MKNIVIKIGCEFVNLTNAVTWRFWVHEDGATILTVEWENTEKDFALPTLTLSKAVSAMHRGLTNYSKFDLYEMVRMLYD
jgi:hypothetical protein